MLKTVRAGKPGNVLVALLLVGFGLPGLLNPISAEACSPPPSYTLTVNITGQGSVNPAGGSYAAGTSLSLQATPAAGWTFNHWEGNLTGTANPAPLIMNSNKTVRAVFTALQTYTLTTSVPGGGGTVNPSGTTSYTAGTSVSVSATPNSGYQFVRWEGNLTGSTNPSSITMNANKSVTAVFAALPTYTLTTSAPGGGGTVSPSGTNSYTSGTSVSVSASPASGYRFDHWEGSLTGTANPASITMNANKTVTAVFTALPIYTLTTAVSGGGGTVSPGGTTSHTEGAVVTITASPSTGYQFVRWEGSVTGSTNPTTVTMNANKSVTAVFVPTYTLTTAVSGGGGTVSPSGTTSHAAGTVVTVSASPTTGYRFNHWEGAVSGSTSPTSVTMDANKTVTAVFSQQYSLTTSVPGGGGTVSPSGVSWHDPGTSVTVTATPAAGYVLDHWEGALGGAASPATVTMNGNKTLTAVFHRVYTLTATVSPGGAGNISPNGSTVCYAGDTFWVHTWSNRGYVFDGWSGAASGSTTPIGIVMDSDKTVTANYVAGKVLDVSIEGPGYGGAILTPPANQNTYRPDTSVTVASYPATGSEFMYWDGDCPPEQRFNASVNLVMDTDKAVSVVYAPTGQHEGLMLTCDETGTTDPPPGMHLVASSLPWTVAAIPNSGYMLDYWSLDNSTENPLTFTPTPKMELHATFCVARTLMVSKMGNGTVTPMGSSMHRDGETVSVSATPAEGHRFVGWQGDVTDTSSSISVTMDENKSVTAVFAEIPPQYTLTTSVEGGGSVDPSGGTYTLGENVLITAIPDEGYDFDHWEGDAVGSGNPLSLTMTSDMHVTAVFSRTPDEYFLTANALPGGIVTPTSGVYSAGQKATVTATPDSGIRFSMWMSDDDRYDGTSTNPLTVAMDRDQNLTAVFVPNGTYLLQLKATGEGTVAANPDDYVYSAGQQVAITASPASGWRFAMWTSADYSYDGYLANPLTVTMKSDLSLTAVFVPVDMCALQVRVVGDGTVERNPDASYYALGTSVELTATPSERFYSWGGDLTSQNPIESLTINKDSLVFAGFAASSGDEDPFDEPGADNDGPSAVSQAEHDQEQSEEAASSDDESENADPIHFFSGEFVLSDTDLAIKGRGFDFEWTRTYRSKIPTCTYLGNNWDHSYNTYLKELDENTLLLHTGGESRREVFTLVSNGRYEKPGFFGYLQKNTDDTFVLHFENGDEWHFHPLTFNGQFVKIGKISRMVDRNGNEMNFSYDAVKRLTEITDTMDRVIHVDYSRGRISRVHYGDREVAYSYFELGDNEGPAGDLKQVRTPRVLGPVGHAFVSGKTTTYSYTKGNSNDKLNHNLLTIRNGLGQVYLSNVYATTSDPEAFTFDRVTRQIWGRVDDGVLNDVIDIEYVEAPQFVSGYTFRAAVMAIVNDRRGHVSEYYYDSHNQTLLMREYTGSANPITPTTTTGNRPTGKLRSTDPDFYDTVMTYNANFLTQSVTYPNGNTVSYGYDTGSRIKEGNLITIDHGAGIVEHYEYLDGFGSRNLHDFVTRAVDANGNVIIYNYDSNGNRIETLRKTPNEAETVSQENFTFTAHGQLATHTHPLNGTSRRIDTFTYGANDGYLEQIVIDSGGLNLETVFERGAFGEILRKADPFGSVTDYTVNALGQTVRVVEYVKDDEGAQKTYQTDFYYDAADRVRQSTRVQVWPASAEGVRTDYTYEILGNVVSEKRYERHTGTAWTDPITTTFGYDDNRNRISTTSPEGIQTRIDYDERELVYEVHEAFGTPTARKTRMYYDANENLVERIDGVGPDARVTTFAYDSMGRLIAITDPGARTTHYTLDNNGNVVGEEIRDAQDTVFHSVERTFDAMNRPTTESQTIYSLESSTPQSLGTATTQTIYNPDSSIAEVINPNGHSIVMTYDGAGRRSSVVDELGNSVAYDYEALDGAQSVTETRLEQSDLQALNETGYSDQTIVTEFHFDGLKRPVKRIEKRTQGADLVTKYSYDSRGNCIREEDARGNVTTREFDGLDRLLEVQLPEGAVVSEEYDNDSRLQRVVDANGNTTEYTYDTLGRVTSRESADGTQHSYEYNIHDEVTTETDANGTEISYLRDALGRVYQKTVTPAPGVEAPLGAEVFTYDFLSNLTYAENDAAVVERVHDSRGNVLAETLTFKSDDTAYTTTSQFDVAGNRTSLQYPSNRTITHTFDALERLKTVVSGGDTLADYRYIGAGNRVERRILGNGTWSNTSFDDRGRPVATNLEALGESSPLDARTYNWDAVHNKTHRSDVRTGGPLTQTAYHYDGLSRMVRSERTPGTGSSVTREYDLDDAGNRQVVTETIGNGPGTDQDYLLQGVDALVNEYTVTPFEALRDYDANGNLTVLGVDANTQNVLAYDYRNLMVRRTQVVTEQPPSGPSEEEVLSQYEYDALGRRISKTVGTVATRYVYDGWRVIEEFTEGGALLGTYVYGSYLDEVITLKRGSEEFFFHTDDLWNTVALTDEDGVVIERYDYGDYGEPEFYAPNGTPRGGSVVANPCLFTGQRYDAESGLYWCKTRYLEPETGRFTTRDILGVWGDPTNLGNGYTYAANNPWSMLDPYGMCTDKKDWYQEFWDELESKYGISREMVQAMVDLASLVPVLGMPADVLATLDALLRGDMTDIGINLLGLVPVIGDFAKGFLKAGEFFFKHGDEAADAWRWLTRGDDALGTVATHGPVGLCFAAGTLVLVASGMVPIEALELGDRVSTTDDAQLSPSRIDETAWRKIELEMQDSSGAGTVEIDLLRPVAWLESLNADEGETIRISLPEMGLEGPAVVEDVEPCPDIEDGPGRIVLATTACNSACVMQLVFEGQDEPLEATARHRFYSEDRKSWVQAARLREGEQLRTQSGLVTLKEVLPVPGTHRVYNLEVETDHCYFVTDDAVLVHNTNPCDKVPRNSGPLRRRMPPPPEGMINPQAHHELPREFRRQFTAAGLDIEDPQFGKWVSGGPQGSHQRDSYNYNAAWRKFFDRNPEANREQILRELERLRQKGVAK